MPARDEYDDTRMMVRTEEDEQADEREEITCGLLGVISINFFENETKVTSRKEFKIFLALFTILTLSVFCITIASIVRFSVVWSSLPPRLIDLENEFGKESEEVCEVYFCNT